MHQSTHQSTTTRRHPDTTSTRSASRMLVKVLGLALLLSLVVPAAMAMEKYELVADGRTVALRAFDTTVGEVLADQGVELGEGDRVLPHPATPVADGMVIKVQRAGDYTVMVDGEQIDVAAVTNDVAGVVHAAGVGDITEARVEPGLTTPSVNGSVVTITRQQTFTVLADGDTHRVTALPGTVGEVMVGAGVTIDRNDRVDQQLWAQASPDEPIVVTRVRFSKEREEITLEHDQRTVETDDRFEGEEVTVTDGHDGRRVKVWRVRWLDGERSGRELLSDKVVEEPVDTVVEVGTAARPEPEPEPEPEPAPEPEPEPDPTPSGSVWDRLAQCESGGQWDLNVGTYDGGLQFHPSTWSSWKRPEYPGYAWQASREQQIETASRLQAALGWGQWPHCSAELGLR